MTDVFRPVASILSSRSSAYSGLGTGALRTSPAVGNTMALGVKVGVGSGVAVGVGAGVDVGVGVFVGSGV